MLHQQKSQKKKENAFDKVISELKHELDERENIERSTLSSI